MMRKESGEEPSNSSNSSNNSSSTVASPCLCHASSSSSRSVYCAVCVQNALQDGRRGYQTAQQQWTKARQQAEHYFRHTHDPTLQVSELQAESERLRQTLELLRKECADVSVATCAQQCRLAAPSSSTQPTYNVLEIRSRLSTLERSTCDGLSTAILHCSNRVRTLRWHYVLRLFELFRLQVEQPKSRDIVSGIGKIAGLPLPHAGPELYGVLPQPELTSALRLVAMLVHFVARCLSLSLPHPILLQPPDKNCSGDIIETASQYKNNTVGEARKETLSMDTSKVRQRVRHSMAAVLQEEAPNGSLYSLDGGCNEIALSLLQNDIMGVCIRAGVPIAELWPGEALLLNLHALYRLAKSHVVGVMS